MVADNMALTRHASHQSWLVFYKMPRHKEGGRNLFGLQYIQHFRSIPILIAVVESEK